MLAATLSDSSTILPRSSVGEEPLCWPMRKRSFIKTQLEENGLKNMFLSFSLKHRIHKKKLKLAMPIGILTGMLSTVNLILIIVVLMFTSYTKIQEKPTIVQAFRMKSVNVMIIDM